MKVAKPLSVGTLWAKTHAVSTGWPKTLRFALRLAQGTRTRCWERSEVEMLNSWGYLINIIFVYESDGSSHPGRRAPEVFSERGDIPERLLTAQTCSGPFE